MKENTIVCIGFLQSSPFIQGRKMNFTLVLVSHNEVKKINCSTKSRALIDKLSIYGKRGTLWCFCGELIGTAYSRNIEVFEGEMLYNIAEPTIKLDELLSIYRPENIIKKILKRHERKK